MNIPRKLSKLTSGLLLLVILAGLLPAGVSAHPPEGNVSVILPGDDVWTALSTGVNARVFDFDFDGSENMIAVGIFTNKGGRIAKWNGTAWSTFTGPSGELDGGSVNAVVVASNGDIYVGGNITSAGGVAVNKIAMWDDSASEWTVLGTGMNGAVWVLALDGSGDLYAGGDFTTAGGVTVNRVAKWDGSWSALSGPSGTGVTDDVFGLDFDSSGNLYAGGSFGQAGGLNVKGVAMWNGAAWSALTGDDAGYGVSGYVYDLVVDGNDDVYVGGTLTDGGGVTVSKIAKWDSSETEWEALGAGTLNGDVNALDVDGSDNLFAGGAFTTADSVTVNKIAKWDGVNWTALTGPSGTGLSDTVDDLAVDNNNNLYAGGYFTTAGGVTVNYVAKWSYVAYPDIAKEFSGTGTSLAPNAGHPTILSGDASTLTITLSNPNPANVLEEVSFTDSLPSGLEIAPTPNIGGTCNSSSVAAGDFSPSLAAGGTAINLVSGSGYDLAASGSCTITVDVKATSAGVKVNTTGAVQSITTGGGANTATDTLLVLSDYPTISMDISPDPIEVNVATTVTYTINNPNTLSGLSGLNFTNTLPAGMTIANPPNQGGTCASPTFTPALTSGGGAINLTGSGALAASGSCTITVDVVASPDGSYTNTTGVIGSGQTGASADTASDTVIVRSHPVISKSFVPSSIEPGGTATLTFTLTNPNTATYPLSDLNFTDTFPAGMVIAPSPNFNSTCSTTTIAGGTAGDNFINLIDTGTLAISGSCNLTVDVTAAAFGSYLNTSSVVSSFESGTGTDTATATLLVALLDSYIFADGFESGDTTAWSNATGESLGIEAKCKLCVNNAAAMEGANGLKVRVPNNKPHYVTDSSPAGEKRYRARFYIDIRGLKMGNLNKIKLFQGRMGTKQPLYLLVRKNGTKYQIRGSARLDSGLFNLTKWYTLPKKPVTVEIDWKAAVSKAKHNGYLKLWVNGKLKQKVGKLNNDSLKIYKVRLGVTQQIKKSFNIFGNFYLDAFISNDQYYIGP